MGGEKLRLSRLVFFVSLFFIPGFFGGMIPLSAQTTEPPREQEQTAGPLLDESAIILGENPPDPVPNGSSSIFVVFRMVLVLALSALAIYGVVFFIKRLARTQEIRDPNLKILARVPLGNDSYAAVLSLGAKAWLVGGGSGGINLISEISDAESLETLLIEDARRTAETGIRRYFNFRSLLKRPGTPPAGKDETPGITHAVDLRKQRERLRGI